MPTRTWTDLFERTTEYGVGVDGIRDALAARRRERADDGGDSAPPGASDAPASPPAPGAPDASADSRGASDAREAPDVPDSPAGFDRAGRAARVVADADVLAADLLAGEAENPARAALDLVRSHSWLVLVASEPLLDDAEAVVAELADAGLAADWRAAAAALATTVEQPPGDHPALASALHGDAAHVLSFDGSLRGVRAGVALRRHVETSVRDPAAFVAVFDAASLYEAIEGGGYPGPDRDHRDPGS